MSISKEDAAKAEAILSELLGDEALPASPDLPAPEEMSFTRCECGLCSKLLPSEPDRQAIDYLTYALRVAIEREGRIAERSADGSGHQTRVREAIARVEKVADTLDVLMRGLPPATVAIEALNQQWCSDDARREALVQGVDTLRLPNVLRAALETLQSARQLPRELRIACDAYQNSSQKWAAKTHPFRDLALARLVAYVEERTGSEPIDATRNMIAEHLTEAGLEQATYTGETLRRWRQHHRSLVQQQRDWVRRHLISSE